jgi:hypothetical protein
MLAELSGELGKGLAGKWLSLLALPGALYLAVAAAARALGQSHALDVPRLVSQVTVWARDPAAATVGGQVVLLLSILAGSVVAGLAARALGSGIEQMVLAANWRSWPRPARALAGRATQARRDRWDGAHERYSTLSAEAAHSQARSHPLDAAPRHAALRVRTAIAAERPDRPTWSGDRINAVSVRLMRDHHLDVALLWPHLWLTLADTERDQVTAARTAMARAAELGAWAALYAVLACLWWPAAIVAVVLGMTTRNRVRSATDTYALLVEATVRLQARDLAQRLGVACDGPLSTVDGDRLTDLLSSAPLPLPAQPSRPVGSALAPGQHSDP